MSLRAKRRNLLAVAAAFAIALGLLTLLALPSTAHACSCAPSGSPAEALADADAVFAGEVIVVRPQGHPPFRLSSADPVAVEFRVSQVWKGPRRETVTVETELSEISCGYEFKEGRKYIVYAYDGETGLCTRTAPAWRAFHDFVALGTAWEPDHSPATGPVRSGSCGLQTAGSYRPDVAALALLAGAIGSGVGRRTRL